MNRLVCVLVLASSFSFAADPAKPALSREAYKKLLQGLASCELKGYEIDGKCPAVKTLQDALKDTSTPWKDILGMNESLGRELLGHAAPAVRVKAAHLMGSILGTGGSSQDAIVAAAAKEKDIGVMQAFVRTVANDGAKNPKVAAFLIKSGDHTDKTVRLQAVYAMSSSWNREMAGGAEKLLAMAGKDTEGDVKRAACEYGGALGNKVFVPFMEKATASADDKVMYTACFKGLVKMFYDYPLFGTSNEAAYKLFLKRLGDKPRSGERPPWTIGATFQRDGEGTNAKLVEWKKANPWFKEADVRKALAGVVADKTTNGLARTGAIGSIAGLGASKAELEALKAGYDEKNSSDKNVLKAIDEALAKAK